jgi:hypothetical protein
MQFLAPMIILLLFIAVRSGDLAIMYAIARDSIRAIAYGVVAILAVVALVIALIH